MQRYVELREQWNWEIFEESTNSASQKEAVRWLPCEEAKECQVTNMQIWLAEYSTLRKRNTKPSSLKPSAVLKRQLCVIVNLKFPRKSFPSKGCRLTWQKASCKPHIKDRDTDFIPLCHQDAEILSDKLGDWKRRFLTIYLGITLEWN